MSHSRQLVSLPHSNIFNASPLSPMWSAQFAALIDLQQPDFFYDPAPPQDPPANTSKHLRVCMGSCKRGSGVEANPTSGQRRCSWVLGSSRLFQEAIWQTTRTGCTQRWRCRRWCQAVGENDLIPKWLSFSTWIYHQSWSPCSHQKCGLKQQPRGNMCVQPSNPFPAITPIYLMLIKESANSECLNHGFYRFKIWDYSTFQTLLKKHDATFQIDTYECRSAQLAPNHTVNQTLGLQLSAGN